VKEIRHISASISGMLKLRRIDWCEDDAGRPLSTQQVKAELRRLQGLGYIYIATSGCDNFDPRAGCLGHVEEEKS